VTKDTRQVKLRTASEFTLVEDYALRIQPESEAADEAKLTVTWIKYVKQKGQKPKARVLQRVPLTIRKGKYLLWGGWKLTDGALLAAVAVQ